MAAGLNGSPGLLNRNYISKNTKFKEYYKGLFFSQYGGRCYPCLQREYELSLF